MVKSVAVALILLAAVGCAPKFALNDCLYGVGVECAVCDAVELRGEYRIVYRARDAADDGAHLACPKSLVFQGAELTRIPGSYSVSEDGQFALYVDGESGLLRIHAADRGVIYEETFEDLPGPTTIVWTHRTVSFEFGSTHGGRPTVVDLESGVLSN